MVDEIALEAASSMAAGSAGDGCRVPPRTLPSPSSGYESGGRLRGSQLKGLQNEALIDDLSIVDVFLLVSARYRVGPDQGRRQRGKGSPDHSSDGQRRDEVRRDDDPGKTR